MTAAKDDKWMTVRIPRKLKESVEEYIKNENELGYNNVSVFIIDAVRRRLETLKSEV